MTDLTPTASERLGVDIGRLNAADLNRFELDDIQALFDEASREIISLEVSLLAYQTRDEATQEELAQREGMSRPQFLGATKKLMHFKRVRQLLQQEAGIRRKASTVTLGQARFLQDSLGDASDFKRAVEELFDADDLEDVYARQVELRAERQQTGEADA